VKQTEIRKTGYKALVDALGVVGMLRFIQQLDAGTSDYTQGRHNAEPTLEDFKQFTAAQIVHKGSVPNA
jgi:hypothetical protein